MIRKQAREKKKKKKGGKDRGKKKPHTHTHTHTHTKKVQQDSHHTKEETDRKKITKTRRALTCATATKGILVCAKGALQSTTRGGTKRPVSTKGALLLLLSTTESALLLGLLSEASVCTKRALATSEGCVAAKRRLGLTWTRMRTRTGAKGCCE